MEALQQACDHLGSQAKLAEALGLGPMAISSWKKRGGIPLKRAFLIEALTGGRVRACDLCPDDFEEFSMAGIRIEVTVESTRSST